MIHSEGVAFNQIDLEAAGARGIYVCNCAGMNAKAVAEQTILLMLGVIKNVVSGDQAVRDGRQMDVKMGYMGDGSLKELSDCTVGLIGFGVGVEDGRAVVVGADFAACGAVGPLRHAVVVGPENAAAAVAEDRAVVGAVLERGGVRYRRDAAAAGAGRRGEVPVVRAAAH